ncbi:MAG: glycoside hydrolase family 97 catalytic domain-containing protein [Dysgonamonadaceae bacterium]|nr:glycoside hydrolase family 97 catalytic domain-containing protein [Dysgonamonadaceae bacterium]
MKPSLYSVCGIMLLLFFACHGNMQAETLVAAVKSPNDSIEVNLLLDDSQRLYYQVKKASEELVSPSQLGLSVSGTDFSSGLSFKNVSSESKNEIKATFGKSDRDIQIVVRAYNDGIAYRYAMTGDGNIAILSETSECRPVAEWEQESCLRRASLPLLVKSNTNYILITEAAVTGNYAASKLITNDERASFFYDFTGSITASLPFESPWRVLLIGTLNNLVESTLIDNLNAPTALTDLSWIKPGRAAWSYGGEDTSGYLTMENIRRYIDWAAEMSWEYFTLDRGWQDNAAFTLEQVSAYAQTKGIGLFIWMNQNKLPSTETELRTVLQHWKNKGAKGLKVDFWENDSQSTMKKYDLLFRLSAEQKLLLNLHSCTKPVGWRKTYPHLLTSEAALGNIYYAQSPNVVTAAHNINQAIVRNALGATDYAPVDFADKNGKILNGTTGTHQLALSVIFESGIQHIIDAPDNIRYHISCGFLKNLPVAWDDTKCIEAGLESHITIARRKGGDWYLASLSNESRLFEAALSFLSPDKTYNAYIYKDGDCSSEILFEYREKLTSQDKITVPVSPKGGFVVRFSPSADFEKPVHVKYEAESEDNTIPFGVSVKNDADSLCSSAKYVAGIGNGRPLTFRKIRVNRSGVYAVTFYYTAKENTAAYVKINNADWKEYSFAGTGTESGSGLAHKTVLAELDAQLENTLEFGNYTASAPNLDRIVIAKTGGGGLGIETPKERSGEGKVYAGDNCIVIEQESHTEYKLYNAAGQLIKVGASAGGTVSIPLGSKGFYIVNIRTKGLEFSKKIRIE